MSDPGLLVEVTGVKLNEGSLLVPNLIVSILKSSFLLLTLNACSEVKKRLY